MGYPFSDARRSFGRHLWLVASVGGTGNLEHNWAICIGEMLFRRVLSAQFFEQGWSPIVCGVYACCRLHRCTHEHFGLLGHRRAWHFMLE